MSSLFNYVAYLYTFYHIYLTWYYIKFQLLTKVKLDNLVLQIIYEWIQIIMLYLSYRYLCPCFKYLYNIYETTCIECATFSALLLCDSVLNIIFKLSNLLLGSNICLLIGTFIDKRVSSCFLLHHESFPNCRYTYIILNYYIRTYIKF